MKFRDFGIFLLGVIVGGWAMKQIVDLRPSHQHEQSSLPANNEPPDAAEEKPPALPPTGPTENFIRGDVREALQKLAASAGVKLVMSDKVQGTITTSLDHLSPREEIEVIANAQGLVLDKGKNGVWYVKTPEERAKEPNERCYFIFKNARAADIKNLLRTQLQSGLEPQVDTRTNTIFYLEDRSNVDAIRKFLELVDRPMESRPALAPNEL